MISRLRPRTRGQWLAAAAVALGLPGAAAVAFTYFILFDHGAPPPLALQTSNGAAAGSGIPPAADQAAGSWRVDSGSVAGYRVREQLAILDAPSDGVGRTSAVSGGGTVARDGGDLIVSATEVNVDVSSLTSDKPMRDRRIHSIGLESDAFPMATFRLTSPLRVPLTTDPKTTVSTEIHGDITIHGVTRHETIRVQARLSGARVEIAGSLAFPWGDFGMEAPNIGGFVKVADTATMEFDVFLVHA
jgi:polyisoprenoid-binding protein YceI